MTLPIDVLEMFERSTPSLLANSGKLYGKDVNGITQLFYLTSAGTEMQLTPVPASANTRSVLLWGLGTISASSGDRYAHYRMLTGSGTASESNMIIPRAGTLRNLYVRNRVAGGGGTMSWTLVLNSVLTALTVSFNSNLQSASNVVNSVAVAAGDKLAMICNKPASLTAPTPIGMSVAIEFE